jgi:hypothetical protein
MTKFPLWFLALLVWLTPTAARAQYPIVQSALESHIQVLGQKRDYCVELVQKANAALADKDYELAYELFKSAVDNLPQAGKATSSVRKEALRGFCEASVFLARQRIYESRNTDARLILEVVLQDRYNPNYRPAKALRWQLMENPFLALR